MKQLYGRLLIGSVVGCTFVPLNLPAQAPDLSNTKNGEIFREDYNGIVRTFYSLRRDSALVFSESLLRLAEEKENDSIKVFALQIAGEVYRNNSDYPKALTMQFDALRLSRLTENRIGEAFTVGYLGLTLNQIGAYRQAINYMIPKIQELESHGEFHHLSFVYSNLCEAYLSLTAHDEDPSRSLLLDTAIRFQKLSRDFFGKHKVTSPWDSVRKKALPLLISLRQARLLAVQGDLNLAIPAYQKLVSNSDQELLGSLNKLPSIAQLAQIFYKKHQLDSSVKYARLYVTSDKSNSLIKDELIVLEILRKFHERGGNKDSVLFYSDKFIEAQAAIYGEERFRSMQLVMFNEQQSSVDDELSRVRQRDLQRGAFLSFLGVLIAACISYLVRNNRRKHRTNKLLSEQKELLEGALDNLKSTQKQLIQSEKMASLGELTAGIAHEIQNPLNFVNNFSEVNADLAQELQDAAVKGDLEEVKTIANDILSNQQKISEHGKRADGIVKSMLQHSRSSGGEKESADVNKLVDEYVRLAYHGYRARQKDFNVKLESDLDPSVGKVNMVKQDIGRVILNLLNNAFYAVAEKARTEAGDYTPTVWVRTRLNYAESGVGNQLPVQSGVRDPKWVTIEVADNGPGIPEPVREKIFQPFFTTKPTGQGTGLGLSLSYDIVTKGNGGVLKAAGNEGEGAVFTIVLPLEPGSSTH